MGYTINWSNGHTQMVDTYEEALAEVGAETQSATGGCAVIGHDGDLTDGGDRTLCWWTEQDAANDDGRKAACTIRRTA